MVRGSALALSFCLLAAPAPAFADICSDLRAELNEAAFQDTGSSLRQRRYADAARRQSTEIAKATRLQRRYNCDRTISPRCDRLERTMQNMQENLAKIEDQQARYEDLRGMSKLRRIRTRIAASGCEEPTRIVHREIRPVDPQGEILRQDGRLEARVIVREGIGRQELRVLDTSARSRAGSSIIEPPAAGTFRTLCVRTCDGYYFPVSFSTNAIFFHRDQQTCSAMCPASETRLYYHRVPDQESEDMISLGGEPYTALPTAFLYRNQGLDGPDPSCTCGKPEVAANPRRSSIQTFEAPAKTESTEPEAAPLDDRTFLEDPETRMNTETGLTADHVRDLIGGVIVGDVRNPGGDRQVRVVGPQFLPDPEEAIDLRSPALTHGR